MTVAFPYGVAAGDPRTDGAVLWTKVESASADVVWEVRRGSAVAATGVASADAEGTVKVSVRGLPPGGSWTYDFRTGGRRSPEGRFRSLPDDDRPLRFGVVSCAKLNAGHFNAYARLAERDDLDMVLHLGDYIYEAADHPPASQTPAADVGRPFDPPRECREREDYRRRYAQYRRDPDVLALHAAHALINTIDDHELADNAWAEGAQEHREEEHGPWAQRRDAALAAWVEWLPTSACPAEGQPVWRAFELGGQGRLVLLETRTARLPASRVGAERATMLGDEQRHWLQAQLDDADRWLVVAVPSMLTSLLSAARDEHAALALRTLKLLGLDGEAFHDRWDAFPRERREILEALGGARARPLVLSGDVHFAAEAVLPGRGGVPEWTTTSVTSQNLDDKLGWPARTLSRQHEQRLVDQVAELRWCDLDSHGFMVVTLDEQRATCEWWAVPTVLERCEGASRVHEVTVARPDAVEGWGS